MSDLVDVECGVELGWLSTQGFNKSKRNSHSGTLKIEGDEN